MAEIYNSNLTQELIEGAKIQLMKDRVPSQLADKVVPVMEVNPKLLTNETLITYATQATTGAITSSSTSLGTDIKNKTVIVTGIYAGFSKDAVCDVATGVITVSLQPKGLAAGRSAILFPVITLKSEDKSQFIRFSKGIELEFNSTIIFSGTYTAGLMSRAYSIYGYTINNSNA